MTSGDQQESVYRYDGSPDESLSVGVVKAVSELSGVDPTPGAAAESDRALAPLYTAVDPEALDALFRPDGADAAQTRGQITFSYEGCEVTASSDGRVTAERLEAAGEITD